MITACRPKNSNYVLGGSSIIKIYLLERYFKHLQFVEHVKVFRNGLTVFEKKNMKV